MTRNILILLCAIVLGVPTPSAAQKPASPSPAPVSISADQARAALDVLNDPAKRAAFTATLNAIVKARPGAPPPPTAAASAESDVQPDKPPATKPAGQGLSIPLAPDSLGAEVLLSASAFVSRLGDRLMGALKTVQSLPLLYGWLVVMATNPIALNLLADVVWRAALVLLCVTAVAYGLRRAIQGPIRRMERQAPVNGLAPSAELPAVESPQTDDALADDALARAEAGEIEARPYRHHRPSAWTLLRRLPLVFARLLLELVPVMGILVVGHLMAGSSLGGQSVSRLIIVAIVSAYALCTALLSVARMLLSPDEPRLRLAYLSDTTSRYLMGWTRRLALIAVFGYAVGEVGLLLGLSNIAHDAIQKAVGLVLHLCLAYIVVRNRRAVRRWLRAPQAATGPVAALRNRFALVWHWVALSFLIGGWVIWAVEVPHGFAAVLHYSAITVLLLIGARLLLLLLLGVVDKVMRPIPDAEGFYRGMQERLHVYHHVVSTALRMTIYLLLVLGLLQLYGLNTILWLVDSMLGQRILSASATLLVTVILAFSLWEAVTFALQRHVDRLQRDDHPGRSARLRTLLPLLRTALLITIAIVAGLMVLSEIGINIGPLLAGAGIVGVAIGFGSQKLVQDLITGVFLLLENAMQVGDVVRVDNLAGVVEGLSVRTIRLRSEDGSVYIIPFSAVTTVTNMTKDYSRAVISVGVAYKENYDHVVDVLKGIVQEMRAEPAWRGIILEDLEVWGLDQFADSAIIIKCRIKCIPLGRWPVMREFNRRMKMRFDEHGIEIPFPHRKLVYDGPFAAIAGPREVSDDKHLAVD